MPTFNDSRPYTSRIIKASALIPDTKTLLSVWDPERDVRQNLAAVRERNDLGKTSRKRLEDVLRIFRQRYFADPNVGRMLVYLTQQHAPPQWIDPLLYFFAAQNDQTLRDIVIDVLHPRRMAGYADLPVLVIQNALREWVAQGKTTSVWGHETIVRVTRNSLATLRDFGVLGGKAHKHTQPVYLPLPSFALIALWLMQKSQSGKRVLHSDEWQLFFMDVNSVEQSFVEAHQQGLLSYYAAGSVIRLEFPAETLTEYAHALLGGTR